MIKNLKDRRPEKEQKKNLEKIFELLSKVLETEWDKRFTQVELFAIMVINYCAPFLLVAGIMFPQKSFSRYSKLSHKRRTPY